MSIVSQYLTGDSKNAIKNAVVPSERRTSLIAPKVKAALLSGCSMESARRGQKQAIEIHRDAAAAYEAALASLTEVERAEVYRIIAQANALAEGQEATRLALNLAESTPC